MTRVTEANKANIIFAMYFIILLETYDEAVASSRYCSGASTLFYDANQLHPHRSLSILPIKLQPILLCRKRATFAIFSHAGQTSLPDLFIYFWNSPMENQKACIQYRHSSRMRERKPSKRLFLSWPPASCEGFARDCPHDGG